MGILCGLKRANIVLEPASNVHSIHKLVLQTCGDHFSIHRRQLRLLPLLNCIYVRDKVGVLL